MYIRIRNFHVLPLPKLLFLYQSNVVFVTMFVRFVPFAFVMLQYWRTFYGVSWQIFPEDGPSNKIGRFDINRSREAHH